MKKLSGLALVLAGSLLVGSIAFSSPVPNTTTPLTDVGPTIKASFTNRLVENNAYSLQGELGARNLRFNVTYGWKFTERQRLKVTGEYLWQYINYSFFSGNTNTWMSQVAVGVNYQLDLAPQNFLRPQLDIGVYGSHAPSKALGNINGELNNQGSPYNYTDERRVAGSNARGASPGVTVVPWRGAKLTTILNYDHVHYNVKYNTLENDADGLGGTINYTQAITDCIDLGLTASVRQPFNYYSANLLFNRVPMLGVWNVGVFADYVNGKNTLPDTYNFGVTANYTLDQSRDDCAPPIRPRRISDLDPDMLAYVAKPAVYMPQVLAIPDNKTVPNCALNGVQYIGPAAPGLPLQTTPFTFAFAPLFTGPNLVYSLAIAAGSGGSPADFTINPTTGVLGYAGRAGGGIYAMQVSAANACGSSSVTFVYINT
jgi:hypothetical protein